MAPSGQSGRAALMFGWCERRAGEERGVPAILMLFGGARAFPLYCSSVSLELPQREQQLRPARGLRWLAANSLVAVVAMSGYACARCGRAGDARAEAPDAGSGPIRLIRSGAAATPGWWKLVASDRSFSAEFPEENPLIRRYIAEGHGDVVPTFVATHGVGPAPSYSILWTEVPSHYTNVDPRRSVEAFQQSALQSGGQKFVKAKETRVGGFTCRDQWTESGDTSVYARTCMRDRLIVTLLAGAPSSAVGREMSHFVDSLEFPALNIPEPGADASRPLHGFYCLDVTAGDYVQPRFSCRRMAGECESMRPMVSEVMSERLVAWHADAGFLKVGSCSYSADPAFCAAAEGRYWCAGSQEVCAQVVQRVRAALPDASVGNCTKTY